MKSKAFLLGLTALSFTAAAQADVTVEITGATAFRKATLLSIHSQFIASGAAFKFVHDQTDSVSLTDEYSNSTLSIWRGTFPGVSGTTTIRCRFNGSVEGIRALVASPAADPLYLNPSVLASGAAAAIGGTEIFGVNTPTETSQSEIAFSDVSIGSTPFASNTLEPSDSAAGVVVFTMAANEGSTVTNVTGQQFRALATKGFQPRSLFNGNTADTQRVYLTGRNDGSGTRTAYLAETGFGIANPVKQYTALVSSGNTTTEIQLVPAGGVNDSDAVTAGVQPFPGQAAANASIIWGQDVDGNGGYSSGSTLVGVLGRTIPATNKVWNAAHTSSSTRAVDLVTWISLNDAITARDAGAVICAYNGVRLNDIAAFDGVGVGAAELTEMSAADKAKVTNGLYTAWSYQQMYRRPSLDADTVAIYDGIKGAIGTNLGAAGIPIADMAVGREVDGGVVGP